MSSEPRTETASSGADVPLAEAQALLDRYISEDVAGFGPAYARLRDEGTPVRALVAAFRSYTLADVTVVATDWDVPVPAVRAALVYYFRHQDTIDAWLRLNDEA